MPGLKRPTYASARTIILLIVGVGLVIYNAVIGDHYYPTFIVALMFCGFPFVLNLDELLRKTPVAPPVKEDEP